MDVEYLKEPKIEFADEFLCEDPKTGISVAGFYSLTDNTHRSEIHYATIGTKQNIQDLSDWLEKLKHRISATEKVNEMPDSSEISEEGEVINLFDREDYPLNEEFISKEVSKKLNPDFPGFNKDSVFKSEFLNSESNNISIKDNHLKNVLESDDPKIDKQQSIIDLFEDAYEKLLKNYITKPDVCFLIIPDFVYKKFSSVQIGNTYLNFRRKLKATLMQCSNDVPVQLILEGTVREKKSGLQDLSMVAWNFVVAQYYKTANCIPWSLTNIDRDTCYIGISFHKVIDSDSSTLRSSVAQAFNRDGKGLVFTGKQFSWDKNKTQVNAPHLKYNYAKELIRKVLKNYIEINKHTPSRVVLHKTTDFWDSFDNPDYAEIEGFTDGIKDVLPNEVTIDFVAIKSSNIRLLNENDNYPVIRGTLLNLTDHEGVLYTNGFIPFQETYPGHHIPAPLLLKKQGETTLRNISKEIMALTKLNFNNCNYYNSLPITISFAKKVGEIIQYLPEDFEPPFKYFYYM